MGTLAKFIAAALKWIWKYGKRAIDAVIDFARRFWQRVKKWVDLGLTITAIIELILRLLGF